MISIRNSNQSKTHIILDLGKDCHGRSMVIRNQEALELAEQIIEKVKS